MKEFVVYATTMYMYIEIWEAAVGKLLSCEKKFAKLTSSLARGIVLIGKQVDSDPFGSGTPSLGLEKDRIDITVKFTSSYVLHLHTHTRAHTHYMYM